MFFHPPRGQATSAVSHQRTGHHPISSQGSLWRSGQGSGNGRHEPAPSLTQFYDAQSTWFLQQRHKVGSGQQTLFNAADFCLPPFLPLLLSVHPVPPPSLAVCCFAKALPRIKQDKQRLRPATQPQRQRKILRFLKDASGFSNLGRMTSRQ